jgi:hypothetical protein
VTGPALVAEPRNEAAVNNDEGSPTDDGDAADTTVPTRREAPSTVDFVPNYVHRRRAD